MQIWKWELEVGHNCIDVPEGTKFIKAGYQQHSPVLGGCLAIWGVVDPHAIPQEAIVHVFATGQDIAFAEAGALVSAFSYVDTIVERHGLVWHVFAEQQCVSPRPFG